MTNATIAAVFEEIADLLDFQGANPFRVRAYRNAARTIHDLSESVAAIAQDKGRKLTDIDGIGDDLALKIATLLETSELPMLKELRAEVPESVLALLRIPGLGPKKAAVLFKELGIKTLDELKVACEAGQVRELKGFGEKTEQMILHGMTIATTANQRIYWADADQIAQALREHLRACPSVKQLEIAGSYRRGKDTVGDLDVLVDSRQVGEVMDPITAFQYRFFITHH